MSSKCAVAKPANHLSPLFRRMLKAVGVGLAALVVAGEGWRSAPAGEGTRAVIDTAGRICPAEPSLIAPKSEDRRTTVSAGARALDEAIMRRLLDAMDDGVRCHRRSEGWPLIAAGEETGGGRKE